MLVRLSPRPGPRCIPTLVGSSEELEGLAATVSELAKLPGPVLIRGESGTGKELVAEALHAHGPRVARPFVAVNLAALAPSLAASQLFGHARGAYTGADRASSGFFGQAEGGTLFLDEVGACPIEVQALLLRALDTGELQVVGGPVRRAEVRVIAATDADLERACAEGSFRSPLYHRLARHTVRIAPLRERPADVAVQAVHFARAALAASGRRWPEGRDGTPWLGRDVVETLLNAPWAGNSRELRATMERLVAQSGGSPTCAPADLDGPPRVAGPRPPVELDVRAALAACDYRLEATAARLGVSRNALKRRMEQEGIRRPIDYNRGELVEALAAAGSLRRAASALGVSEHGLRGC